jgi:hypothetical protein
MNSLEIYLTKSRKINVTLTRRGQCSPGAVVTFNRNIMAYGFVCSPDLTEALTAVGDDDLGILYKQVMSILKQMTGAHQVHKPMYPNFPKQVMEASDTELFINAMTHYFMAAMRDMAQGQPRAFGGPLMEGAPKTPITDKISVPLQWLPEYNVEDREPLPEEEVTLRVINLGSEEDFYKVFTRLIGANGSLSESDKSILQWFAEHRSQSISQALPQTIPNKENLAFFIGSLIKLGENASHLLPYLKTSTDVLRVAVVMSGGDVSLAENTKFRRFHRPERRFLLDALEAANVSLTEDMLRRPEVWKRLARELRPNDYAQRYPQTIKAFDIVCKDAPFETFANKVEKGLAAAKVGDVAELLKARPGDFARRLDHLLRLTEIGCKVSPGIVPVPVGKVIEQFRGVADKVSTPVLLQVHAHFRNRNLGVRSFFPKGNTAKVWVDEKALPVPGLSFGTCDIVSAVCRNALIERFKKLPSLGNVYVDPALKTQFVPFAQRSASKSLRTISRGSRLDLPDCSILRFFVWWMEPKGHRTDIDLAACLFDTNWKRQSDISYYNLKEWDCAHSGDITSAPKGAAEFIDVNLNTLQEKGIRYISMIIYSYTQQAFKDLPECFAGWMAREAFGGNQDGGRVAQNGEIFDGRTVQDKIDIAGNTTVNIPLIIDVEERQVIWSDIALASRGAINNSRRNSDNLSRMGRAMANLVKPNLYDLFKMHAEGRGTLVGKSEADMVFGFDGGVTPFDCDKIMSEFMA